MVPQKGFEPLRLSAPNFKSDGIYSSIHGGIGIDFACSAAL